MVLRKVDFTFHKLISNKFVQQTYLAYLSRGKEKYEYKYVYDGWSTENHKPVASYIVATYDFIVRCNNAIHRRGEHNIEDIKILYDTPVDLGAWVWGNKKIEEYINDIQELENEVQIEMKEYLSEIINWKDKFEVDYEGFKRFIYDAINYFDSQKYSWVIKDNIVYNPSYRDKEEKKFICTLENNKVYEDFKKEYEKNIYVEDGIDDIVEDICSLFMSVSDTYNLLISKKIDEAIEYLEDYISENEKMKYCRDIYYAKIFVDVSDILNLIKDNKTTQAINSLKRLFLKEIAKYPDVSFLVNANISDSDADVNQYFYL